MSQKKPKYKLVMVEWEDIVSTPDWTSEEIAKKDKPSKCCSVGWIVIKTDNLLTLVATQALDEPEAVSDRITIPIGAVKTICPLRLK